MSLKKTAMRGQRELPHQGVRKARCPLSGLKGQGARRGIVIARDAGYIDLKGEKQGNFTVRYVVPRIPRPRGPTRSWRAPCSV